MSDLCLNFLTYLIFDFNLFFMKKFVVFYKSNKQYNILTVKPSRIRKYCSYCNTYNLNL